ncbi:MAG: SIS domain-containing protein [Amnibacterium sp.]
MTGTLSADRVGEGTATEREIVRQPDVWREAAARLAARRSELDAFLSPLLARPELRIVLTGAGTSAFVGEVAGPFLTGRLRRRVDAIATTDLVADPVELLAEDVPTLLVSFARSGDSPESTAATQLADRLLTEVHHLVITCDPTGALHRAHAGRADSFVLEMPERANDAGFAMTSSFTSMLLSVLLALTGDADVEAVAAAAESVIARRDVIEALAVREPARIVYLGSGALTGLARESALKLLETAAGRIVAVHDSSLGFRHGPKALVDDRTFVIVFCSAAPYTRAYDLDIAAELRASIGEEAVLTVAADATDAPGTFAIGGLEGLPDALLALPYVVFAQLFALHTSQHYGVPTDNPFPSGDVNRVVQGVTIHPLEG